MQKITPHLWFDKEAREAAEFYVAAFGDGSKITHYDFLTDKTQEIDTEAPDPTILGGHGGGDYGLMHSFVAAVAKGDPGLVLSGPQETLESHLIVFAAEKARTTGRVVAVRGEASGAR